MGEFYFGELDPASAEVVRASMTWPLPLNAVGPILIAAILVLVLIALGEILAPAQGPRR